MTHFVTKTLAALAMSGALAAATPALADHHNEQPDIVQTAAGADQFSTLVTAVQAADLAGTLSGDGPFTVFAPTNAAFDALPQGTVAGLLDDKPALTQVLTYHVVAGEVSSDDLIHLIRDGDGHATIETLAGGTLTARLSNGNIVLTDAADRAVLVTQADIGTSNGVIHVLDRVLLPG